MKFSKTLSYGKWFQREYQKFLLQFILRECAILHFFEFLVIIEMWVFTSHYNSIMHFHKNITNSTFKNYKKIEFYHMKNKTWMTFINIELDLKHFSITSFSDKIIFLGGKNNYDFTNQVYYLWWITLILIP